METLHDIKIFFYTIFGAWGLYWLGFIALFIYLFVRRRKIKKTEQFEDRDN